MPGLITAKSDNLEKNCHILEKELLDVRQWCENENIPLNSKKIELIHFSRKQNPSNPELQILPTFGETTAGFQTNTLMSIPLGQSLRWLGVYFDQKLTFRQHVVAMAQKGKTAAQALRMLRGTTRGALAHVLQHAMKVCVLPILTFEAEAWWPPPH